MTSEVPANSIPSGSTSPTRQTHRTPEPWLRTRPGRNVTYTNPQRWLPGFRPDDGDEDPLAGAARPVSGGWPATCQLVLLSSYRLIMFDWATSRTTPPGVTVEREIAFLELMHTHLHADHAADENSPSLTCSRGRTTCPAMMVARAGPPGSMMPARRPGGWREGTR